MGFVDKMTFKNARANLFEARRGGQCFWLGLEKLFLGYPRVAGCGPQDPALRVSFHVGRSPTSF